MASMPAPGVESAPMIGSVPVGALGTRRSAATAAESAATPAHAPLVRAHRLSSFESPSP